MSPSPIGGEPVAIELANTVRRRRAEIVDGLATVEDARQWLAQMTQRVGDVLGSSTQQSWFDEQAHADAVLLRDSVRVLLADTSAGRPLDHGAADVVNRMSSRVPTWLRLDVDGPHPAVHLVAPDGAPAGSQALGWMARDTVLLLTGPSKDSVRACAAPGCLLFYVQTHGGRAWCSTRCSNRVRSARMYARRRANTGGADE